MDEYIDREALLALVRPDDPNDEKAAITIAAAKKLIRSLAHRVPAADVAPVRHGRWVDRGDYVITAYGSLPVKMCSECYMDVTIDDFDSYCPNCGAKMDLEAAL